MCAVKRILVVCVLAVVLLGLVGTPAPAAREVSAEPYPPSDVPILLPTFPLPGEWAFSSADPGVPGVDGLLYQAAEPGVDYPSEPGWWPDVSYRAVPLHNYSSDDKVIACLGWIGTMYGQVKNVPRTAPVTIDIVSDDGSWSQHFGPADIGPYWTGPTAWDQWWTDWLNYAFAADPPFTGPFTPFNPKINAGVYWNHLYLPVGPFPGPGLYHLYIRQDQVLPVNELTFYDPEFGPWPHGVWHKGWLTFDNYDAPYDFWVQ